MSHGKIREDKTCLNCGHQVEERFCPHCGQENAERRQPFYFLFTHFIEDFTHYDGQFWGTVKNLLFKPGKLTNTYLEGKRQIFVPPVKLYIFVSFITFFLFALFPPFKLDYGHTEKKGHDVAQTAPVKNQVVQNIVEGIETEKSKVKDSSKIEQLNQAQTYIQDSLKKGSFQEGLISTLDTDNKIADETSYRGYKTQEEYDKGTANKKNIFSFINDPFARKFFSLKEEGVKKGDILRNLVETSFHNLPKALFIYLPIFAFFLWIFHNKRKWWYFDHGIFTLHYFSFLLVSILILALLIKAAALLSEYTFFPSLLSLIIFVISAYGLIYFFIAHRRVYKSHGIVSIMIGGIIFFLNLFAFIFLATGLALVSFLMLH
ncbi:DUF3667 domain-containing protein [Chryseobacterium tructae]|uniref:DUF3667 domain-containing protein n=1 Tax=Chryseobacterium tructae TaxID=1037380 RepID=A0ABV7XTZ1_9FLAO|nr:DUF3667 domain-containing protein [Chryseobacterium tructae]MDN3691064.1 DUF3667 domain-containing protein [Chryseobacterium tructae]